MKIINPNSEEKVVQTEELRINGASLIFYSVKVLKKPLLDKQIDELDSLSFNRIKLRQGYVKKIFNINNNTSRDHLIYLSDKRTELSPVSTGSDEMIYPVVNHYITLYSKSIILVQSVIIFDKRGISKYPYCTSIQSTVDTNLILKIIHKIKDQEDDWYPNMVSDIDKIVSSFLKQIIGKGEYSSSLFLDTLGGDQQSLSLQIWDIASKSFQKEDEINGEELASCYELELSAILSCYNEHFSKDGLWKQQSANQVHRSALSKTDVLMDHQVLLSERVCIEISQVDHPILRPISATRLSAYGYDSTSIFLWGYIVIMNIGYVICDMKSFSLQNDMKEMIKNKKNYSWTNNDIIRFTIEKQDISRELGLYNSFKNICIEERHKDFINNGATIKGLIEIHDRIKRIFGEINELSRIFLESETSSKSNEIGELLKEVKESNKRNGDTSTYLSLISVFVAILALIPLKDDLSSFKFIHIPCFETIWVCTVLGCALVLVIWILYNNYRRKN